MAISVSINSHLFFKDNYFSLLSVQTRGWDNCEKETGITKRNVAGENPKSAAVFYFLLFQQCWWWQGAEAVREVWRGTLEGPQRKQVWQPFGMGRCWGRKRFSEGWFSENKRQTLSKTVSEIKSGVIVLVRATQWKGEKTRCMLKDQIFLCFYYLVLPLQFILLLLEQTGIILHLSFALELLSHMNQNNKNL